MPLGYKLQTTGQAVSAAQYIEGRVNPNLGTLGAQTDSMTDMGETLVAGG